MLGNIKQKNLQKVSEGASRELDWIRSEKLDRSRNCFGSLRPPSPLSVPSELADFPPSVSEKTLPLRFCSSWSRALEKLTLVRPDSSRGGDTNHFSPDEKGGRAQKRRRIRVEEPLLWILILCFIFISGLKNFMSQKKDI